MPMSVGRSEGEFPDLFPVLISDRHLYAAIVDDDFIEILLYQFVSHFNCLLNSKCCRPAPNTQGGGVDD